MALDLLPTCLTIIILASVDSVLVPGEQVRIIHAILGRGVPIFSLH
jgi:hypothetical protein